MFEVLELERLIESKTKITLVPPNSGLLTQMLVTQK